MLSAKDATKRAAEYLQEVKNVYDITLEEIEISEDKKYWLITLSYTSSTILDANEYWKVFKVDAETGEVLSMKTIR